MSGIAGVIRWNEQPVSISEIQKMSEIVSQRGSDGLWFECKAGVGLGYASFEIRTKTVVHQQPIWMPDGSCAIVADASIYNRDDLLKQLGPTSWWGDEPSDAALILSAYDRWGEDLLGLIDGDFAFAIWDGRRERIFAARDPFGIKPLFYWQSADLFLFGSEPKQLLVMPEVHVKPDDETIGEFLLWNFKDAERTFFKNLRRLKPAHFIVATSGGARQRRWWNPDPYHQTIFKKPSDYADRFRELLKLSIKKRLNTDFPIGAHLSGGFDSSSIVALAADIYGNGSRSRQPLETISAVYDGLPCDESRYIRAVSNRVPFQSNTFDPRDIDVHFDGISEALWQRDSPFARIYPAFPGGCNEIMSKMGARILLDGSGGDQLAQFYSDWSDLIIVRRYETLIRKVWSSSGNSFGVFVRELSNASRGAMPESIKRPYRQIRGQRKPALPDWISPQLADYLHTLPPDPVREYPRFRSYRQNETLRLLSHPALFWGVETLELDGAYNNYEVRFPYLDRPLVEFVLSIPLEKRLEGEQWRYLQRRGLAEDLPPAILNRRDQTVFDSYFMQALEEIKPKLMDHLFISESWHSAPYVKKAQAERLYKDFSPADSEYYSRFGHALWSIASLELWLRGLTCYKQYTKEGNNNSMQYDSTEIKSC